MAFRKTTFPLSSATRLAKHRTFTNSEIKKNERNLPKKCQSRVMIAEIIRPRSNETREKKGKSKIKGFISFI
jgi:hypothetical protein